MLDSEIFWTNLHFFPFSELLRFCFYFKILLCLFFNLFNFFVKQVNSYGKMHPFQCMLSEKFEKHNCNSCMSSLFLCQCKYSESTDSRQLDRQVCAKITLLAWNSTSTNISTIISHLNFTVIKFRLHLSYMVFKFKKLELPQSKSIEFQYFGKCI